MHSSFALPYTAPPVHLGLNFTTPICAQPRRTFYATHGMLFHFKISSPTRPGIVHLSRIVHERRAAVTRIIGHKIHTIFQDYLFIKEYI